MIENCGDGSILSPVFNFFVRATFENRNNELRTYSSMIFKPDFPSTFWFTGIIDGTFTFLYVVFATGAGLTMRDLFLPEKEIIHL